MAYVNHHVAPGLGDLVGGWFSVPQNPIRDVGTPLKASINAMVGGRPVYRPRIGDLIAGSFTVPQNPVRAALVKGMRGLGCASCSGMGDTDLASVFSGQGSIMDWVTTPNPTLANLPNWVLIGGAIAAYMFLGGKKRR